jgi:hypothetical protein
MKSTAVTELIERQAICLVLTRRRKPACVRIRSLARASMPSTSALGVTERLCFFQSGVEAGAVLFHFREDEVAGAVEDSGDFE